jgi:hypothetical protein
MSFSAWARNNFYRCFFLKEIKTGILDIKISGCMKGCELFSQLSDYQLLNKGFSS